MPTRNVVLTDQQSQLVDEFVRGGRYQNASEVLREGLRLLADRRAMQDTELDDIRSGVLRGLDHPDAGDFAAGTGEETVRRAFDQLPPSAIEKPIENPAVFRRPDSECCQFDLSLSRWVETHKSRTIR